MKKCCWALQVLATPELCWMRRIVPTQVKKLALDNNLSLATLFHTVDDIKYYSHLDGQGGETSLLNPTGEVNLVMTFFSHTNLL